MKIEKKKKYWIFNMTI